MILKDIYKVQNDPELYEEYQRVHEKVKASYTHSNTIESYVPQSGYAQKTYRGQLKQGVEISELELSMLLDRGFSHFGGSSSISSDGKFTVVIYTD
ncbi:hypothetical protein [Paenibacillus sp. USHLN196]|uniref:hypothetical protein n=1 Tax=Paenibacillus sp. USHLN196 TaxID=3081291 RepID=UPI00301A1B76